MRLVRSASILLVVVATAACDAPTEQGKPGQPGAKYASPGEQLLAEFGGEVPQAAVDRVLAVSKMLTLEARTAGIQKMAAAIRENASVRGYDATAVDDLEDFNLGQPLAGVGDYVAPKLVEALTPDNPNKKHFECPPMEMQGYDSCVQIVDALMAQVKADVDVEGLQALAKKMFEEDPVLAAQSQEFKDFALQYLDDLALDVHNLGIHVAAIRAEYALRKAGVCDNRLIDGAEIARLRGIQEGELIIRRLVAKLKLTLAPQGNECLKVGPKGAQTEAIIKAEIEAFIKETPAMCPDMSTGNENQQKLDKLRREGIQRAIDAHVTTIWIGIFRNGRMWQGNDYVVLNLDGCEAKDQIEYTTSPLVLDLDGDGLELTTDRVRFDLRATGEPQQVTWASPREGFLVLDLNSDGRITSGRELFGDRSVCGSERCADGAAALAIHDDARRGGNQDGLIDARDAVFGRLKVWLDRNHDGKSQPEELSSLREHGIRSISLLPTPMDQRVPGGRLSLSLKVDTDRGPRTAYDVWFDNLTSPGFSTPAF